MSDAVQSLSKGLVFSAHAAAQPDWDSERRQAEVKAYVKELTSAYLADPSRVDPTLATGVLAVAAANGDRALLDELRKRVPAAKDPIERGRLLHALGAFRDPALVREALGYVLDPALRTTEITTIPYNLAADPVAAAEVSRWSMEHYDEVAARIPDSVRPYITAFTLRGACTEAAITAAQSFYADPRHAAAGTDRELAKNVDAVRDCIALRAREGPSVATYLRTVDPR